MYVEFAYSFAGIHSLHEAHAEGFTFTMYPYLF